MSLRGLTDPLLAQNKGQILTIMILKPFKLKSYKKM